MIHGERCFGMAAAILWNNNPFNTRQCEALDNFKKKVKTYFFIPGFFFIQMHHAFNYVLKICCFKEASYILHSVLYIFCILFIIICYHLRTNLSSPEEKTKSNLTFNYSALTTKAIQRHCTKKPLMLKDIKKIL